MGALARPETRLEADTSRKFSPSKLETYRGCPRRYRYRYLDGIRRGAQTVEAWLGSCVHKALETLYDARLHGRCLSLEETLREFDRAWEAGWSDAIVVHDPRFGPEHHRSAGRGCVRWYYEAYAPFDRDQTLGVERRLGFALEAGGATVRVEGLVDRLARRGDGVLEIHDYKTTATLPAQAELDEDWQLGIYDIAVREAWPEVRDVELVWHFVRLGQSGRSRRDEARRRVLREELSSLVREILGDHRHAPRRSRLCDWCEYRDLCPLWASARAAPGRGDGESLVRRCFALDQERRRLKEDLRRLELETEAVEAAVIELAEGMGLRGEAPGAAGEPVVAVACPEGEAVVSRKDDFRVPSRTRAPEVFEAAEAGLRAVPLWSQEAHLDLHRVLERYARGEYDAESRAAIEGVLSRHQGDFEAMSKTTVRLHRKREPEPE